MKYTQLKTEDKILLNKVIETESGKKNLNKSVLNKVIETESGKKNLNKSVLKNSINELKLSKKQYVSNLEQKKIENVKTNSKLTAKVNELINKTNKTVIDNKNITQKKEELKKNTSNKDVITDKDIIKKNKSIVKTESNQFGQIIPICFTIIALVCSGLLIYTKQVNIYTLLLLSLVISLTVICHCSIGDICIFNAGKTLWQRTRLGQRCNYTKSLYFSALLSGFFVSYIIFSYDMIFTFIRNIKKFF